MWITAIGDDAMVVSVPSSCIPRRRPAYFWWHILHDHSPKTSEFLASLHRILQGLGPCLGGDTCEIPIQEKVALVSGEWHGVLHMLLLPIRSGSMPNDSVLLLGEMKSKATLSHLLSLEFLECGYVGRLDMVNIDRDPVVLFNRCWESWSMCIELFVLVVWNHLNGVCGAKWDHSDDTVRRDRLWSRRWNRNLRVDSLTDIQQHGLLATISSSESLEYKELLVEKLITDSGRACFKLLITLVGIPP